MQDYTTWKRDYDAKVRREKANEASKICRALKSPTAYVLVLCHEDGETRKGFANKELAATYVNSYGGMAYGFYFVGTYGQTIALEHGDFNALKALVTATYD